MLARANLRVDAIAPVFPNVVLHVQELRKDAGERTRVPFVHLPSQEALDVFREYAAKPDRVPY